LFINARYDSRNSFVNPTLGSVVQFDAERAFHTTPENSQFTRLSMSLQNYSIVFYPTTVLALRWVGQGIIGDNLPVQVLSSVGGNNTLRGSPQDRYLDKVSSVVNAELRFPLYWRFGGVVGMDAGKVWNTLGEVDLGGWATNPSAGLRLHMETFVVRLDIGFGKETTGVYFNFGQIF
jgi:outer membrane protein assembly factor BamA